jgi:transcriptional regulator with XRE-family HTH domain
MARKEGSGRIVDDTWRERVETRLVELKWTRADLARAARLGKSTVSDLLNGKTNECVDLERIHSALGWDPPLGPILSSNASELFAMWNRLDSFEQGRVLERVRAIYEQHVAGRPPLKKT